MTTSTWHTSKNTFCEHVGHEITLETEIVYPAEHLPEQQPRVMAHRCSNAMVCNQFDKPACIWCGTNPDYIPL
jgi:hypothetical protein